MLPSLKCQIFHFGFKFVLLKFVPNYLDKNHNFPNYRFVSFLYIWQSILMQKIKKI